MGEHFKQKAEVLICVSHGSHNYLMGTERPQERDCSSKICLVPQQVLYSHFLCFFSSDLTGDVFKSLGCWSAILKIVNPENTKIKPYLQIEIYF